MASKDYVLRALSDRHLRAIGKVAAQWSSLEFAILRCISDIAGIDHKTSLVMIAAQGFPSWCELLKALSGDVTPKPKPRMNTPTELESLVTLMLGLHKHRNNIIHCSWSAPYGITPGMGLIGMYSLPTPKAHEKATGIGLKKRERDPMFPIEYSASDMLAIAKRIDRAESALLGWRRRWIAAREQEASKGILGGLLRPNGN